MSLSRFSHQFLGAVTVDAHGRPALSEERDFTRHVYGCRRLRRRQLHQDGRVSVYEHPASIRGGNGSDLGRGLACQAQQSRDRGRKYKCCAHNSESLIAGRPPRGRHKCGSQLQIQPVGPAGFEISSNALPPAADRYKTHLALDLIIAGLRARREHSAKQFLGPMCPFRQPLRGRVGRRRSRPLASLGLVSACQHGL